MLVLLEITHLFLMIDMCEATELVFFCLVDDISGSLGSRVFKRETIKIWYIFALPKFGWFVDIT